MENQKLQHNLKVLQIADEVMVAADDYLVQGPPVVPDYAYKSQHCGIPDTPRHRNIRIMTKDAGFACKMQPRDGSGLKEAVVILLILILSWTAQGAYVDVVDGLSPVGYWRLGESAGNTANDRSSNTLNGTYSGATLGATGALNGDSDTAVDFDGFNDDMITVSSNVLRLTGDMSVSFWVDIDVLPGASATDPLCVIEADAQGSGLAKMTELTVDENGDVVYTHQYGTGGSGSEQHVFTSANLDTDTWYNIAVTRDTTASEVMLYIDGSYLDTFSYTNQPQGGGSGTLYLGKYGSDLYDGSVDEIAVFDYELTGTNVSDIYEAANPVPEPATIALLGLGSLALIHSRRR
ncbi:MAG: LamG domain-containing protein [Planctomycetota bacterium]|nr:MAG: LamG domain-containing protein [Planctomycetota bacterium]